MVLNEIDSPALTTKPIRHGSRIAHRSTQQEELGGWWSKGQDELIVYTAGFVTQHLILIDH